MQQRVLDRKAAGARRFEGVGGNSNRGRPGHWRGNGPPLALMSWLMWPAGLSGFSVTGAFRVSYPAAKAGQIGLTTALAREVAQRGIRVNCMAPSGTLAEDRVTARDFGITAQPPELPPGELAAQEKYRQETRLSEIPMGRRGAAEEQAAAIAFLASHDASYITGQVLAVGGGQPYPF